MLIAVAAAAAALTGCSSGNPGDLSRDAAQVLQPAVQHVREVASTGNFGELRAAVAQLKDLVRQEERAGNVTPSRATAILDAADALLTDAREKMSPSPTPTTESPTPSPTPTTESPTPIETTTSPTASVSVGVGDGGNGQSATP
jgi:hypothetical protein